MQKRKPALQKAQPTYGQYLAMVQGGDATKTDSDRYAWAQYQRLFDINHRAMDQARSEALARQLARGH